jgi:hypothetical protein
MCVRGEECTDKSMAWSSVSLALAFTFAVAAVSARPALRSREVITSFRHAGTGTGHSPRLMIDLSRTFLSLDIKRSWPAIVIQAIAGDEQSRYRSP